MIYYIHIDDISMYGGWFKNFTLYIMLARITFVLFSAMIVWVFFIAVSVFILTIFTAISLI